MKNNNLGNFATIQTSLPFEPLLTARSTWSIEGSNPKICSVDLRLAKILNLNIFHNFEVLEINSISHASRILKDRLKNWVNVQTNNSGRATLIQNELPYFKPKLLRFLEAIPDVPLGHWALLDKNHIFLSSACSSKTPHGVYNFSEDKEGPPSRAYLKLWELFSKISKFPSKNSICVDLGASPGGWTSVLANLSKEVIAIDKAPLESSIEKLKNVKFIKDDILKLRWASNLNEATWLFCDAALSPEKLIPIFKDLLANYPKLSFACTLKQKGLELCKDTLAAANVPGTNLTCLSNNKHELTWYRVIPGTYDQVQ